MEWYTNNYLSPNPDKWHLLLSKGNELFVTIGKKAICNSSNEKIIGVVFDNKLNFNCHLDKLCKKAGQKIHTVARESQTKGSYYECLHIFSVQLLSIIVDALFSFNKFENKQNSPHMIYDIYILLDKAHTIHTIRYIISVL